MKYILLIILIDLILLTVCITIFFFIYKKKYCYNNLKYPFSEPSFVISINPDRYIDFKNLLKHWNSHINLYNGVIGIKLKREELISDGILDKDSDLTLGQIGCWLSHYNLWKKIKDEKISYMTIFEDDVNIDVSYNTIKLDGDIFRVATIDTMMSFYLLFLYANRPYYNPRRTLCLCEYLFKIQQKNRLKMKGLLRRFSITCYGKQKTLEDIRTEKSKQYKKLKTKKKSNEYDKWFLRYDPEQNIINKVVKKPKKTKEDIINEAKLALEAKAITSKAVIAELEKINKFSKNNSEAEGIVNAIDIVDADGADGADNLVRIKNKQNFKKSSISKKMNMSKSSSTYLSKLLMNRSKKMKTRKNNKIPNKPQNIKRFISEKEFRFIQNDFSPSKSSSSLTDDKIYNK